MKLDLENSTALVTASTGGIGQEIAASLAREGAKVIVNGRSQKSVDAVMAAIKSAVPSAKLEALIAAKNTG